MVIKKDSFIKRQDTIVADLIQKVEQIIVEQRRLHAAKIASLEQEEQRLNQELNHNRGAVAADIQHRKAQITAQLHAAREQAFDEIDDQLVVANFSVGLNAVLSVAVPGLGNKNI